MTLTRTIALSLVATALVTLGGAAAWFSHEGYRLYVVKTGSMSPAYDPGDVVIDKPAGDGYRPGDVLTFQISAAGDLVTHRFTHLDKEGMVHTKGDNNKTADAWALRPEQVRGVVDRHIPNLGYLVVFLRQPAGIGSVMTSALAVILLWGLCFPAVSETATAPARKKKSAPIPVRVPRQRLASVSTTPPAAVCTGPVSGVRDPVAAGVGALTPGR